MDYQALINKALLHYSKNNNKNLVNQNRSVLHRRNQSNQIALDNSSFKNEYEDMQVGYILYKYRFIWNRE